jgi:hypothetical protein
MKETQVKTQVQRMVRERAEVLSESAFRRLAGIAIVAVAASWGGGAACPAAERPRIDERYAGEAVGEVPDFRQHVVPLVGKLGCNGRACHGSFQGQGGLRLSLFGYDFKADHENLRAGDEPRTNLERPEESLVLTKPLEEVDHGGGKRLEKGTWQHRVLLEWIKDGGQGLPASAAEFVRLEVTPGEMVAARKGDTWQLKAVAVWSDGSREDVTPLCRFQSNNDQVVKVEPSGAVTAVGPGDSHVVAFYDNGVVPLPVIFPVSDLVGPAYPDVPTPTRVDELVVAKLRKLGEVPSDPCTDAEFLRRVSLDMTGTLPAAAEAAAFLADDRTDKRALKIDELLERPAYAAWWATRFCDWTGNNSQVNQNNGPDRRKEASLAWYEWMRSRIARNVPYDEIVEGIVMARSRLEGESYADYCQRMSAAMRDGSETSLADQPTLPYFWSRSNFNSNEERALGFAYTFLGVRIQCAQCHKHPFDQWTKDDFDRFENFFPRVKYGQAPGTAKEAEAMIAALGIDPKKKGNELDNQLAKLAAKGSVVPFRETFVAAPPKPLDPRAIERIKKEKAERRQKLLGGRTATVLGGEEFKIDEMEDPREVLMDWMRDDDNPYFARAIVNRVWSAYFNVGIVEPPDDLSLANPPSNAALLDHLADGFRAHGYDLKWLHREIATSRTYQLGWRTNDTNRLDERNFARAVPRRIPAEVVLDSIRIATAGDKEAAALQSSMKGRAIADAVVSPRGGNYALTVFGRSIRESNCDCDRSLEPSLLQTVFLQNDQEVTGLINRKGGWVDGIDRGVADDPATAAMQNRGSERRTTKRNLDRMQERLEKARAAGDQKEIAQLEKTIAFLRTRLDGMRAAGRRGGAAPAAAPAAAAADTPPATAEREFSPAEESQIARLVEQAYLRTLTRPPRPEEVARAVAHFQDTGDLTAGARDLLWALLNTKEFVVNH